MQALHDDWVSAEMELPGLLAPIPNGAATCIFWMSMQFYYFFHAARTQPGQGPPIPCMTKCTKQLHLHFFAQMAPCILAWYLLAGCPGQLGPKVPSDETPICSTWVQNPHPNVAFHAYNKVGCLGTVITKHPAPMTTKAQPMCLSYHMRNMCNSNCLRAADHCTHNAMEDNLILAWAKLAFAPA